VSCPPPLNRIQAYCSNWCVADTEVSDGIDDQIAYGIRRFGICFLGTVKAFFYAGSRALLVSHWPVSSEAAVALTIRMLTEYENNTGGIGRTEALRRSMLALMINHQNSGSFS